MFNQGMVLYETIIKGPEKYLFELQVHDFALVYIDDKFFISFNRSADSKRMTK